MFGLSIKLILLILTATSAIFAIFLENFIPEKTSVDFKRWRWALVIITIILMFFQGGVLAYDHFDQERKENKLNNQLTVLDTALKNARDSITNLVRSSGEQTIDSISELKRQQVQLERTLNPFVQVAMARYPTLTQQEALLKLQEDVGIVSERVKKQETIEEKRTQNELESQNLKRTPPNFSADLFFTKGELGTKITFFNKIPIEVRSDYYAPGLERIPQDRESIEQPRFNLIDPNISMKQFVPWATFKIHKLPNVPTELKLKVSYRSKFFQELRLPELKGEIWKTYNVDWQQQTVIEKK